MSNQAHALPGQSIIERLCARGNRRLNVGPSQAFYDRFGVTDPWHFDGQFDVAEDAEVFSFLSAVPYYQRVRAQQNAAVRARRRLMERLAGQRRQSSYMDRASRRMTAATATGRETSWLQAPEAFGSAAVDLVMIEAPPAVEEGVEEVEAATARPVYRDRRRPLRRAAARAAVPENDAIIRELELLARGLKGERRQEVVEAARTIRSTPHARRASVVKQVERRLRGASRRVVGSTMRRGLTEQSYTSTESTPVERANSRAASVVGARSVAGRAARGLRPITSSSPMLATLVHEDVADQEAATADAAPRAIERRAASVPAARRRASAHRSAPESAASREARTQQVAGRAGPASVSVAPLNESRGTTAAPSATMARRAASRFSPSALTNTSDRPASERLTARLARVAEDVSGRSAVDVRRGVSAAGRADLVATASSRAAGFDPVMALPATPEVQAEEGDVSPAPSRRVSARSASRRPAARRAASTGSARRAASTGSARRAASTGSARPAASTGSVSGTAARAERGSTATRPNIAGRRSSVAGVHRATTRAALRSTSGQFGASSGLLAPSATDYVGRSSSDGSVRTRRVASLRAESREVGTRTMRTAFEPSAVSTLAAPEISSVEESPATASAARPTASRRATSRRAPVASRRSASSSSESLALRTPMAQRATGRVAARLARVTEASGQRLAASPASYVLASPEPVGADVESTTQSPAPRRSRSVAPTRRQASAERQASASAERQASASAERQASAPAERPSAQRSVVRSARSGAERAVLRSERPVAVSTVRAAARGVTSERHDDQGRRLFAPSSTGHVHNAARMASRPSSLAEAAVPATVLAAPAESSVDASVAGSDSVAKTASRRAARAARTPSTIRAASRSVQAPRVDAAGRARLTASPTDYLAAASAAPQASLSRSAAVARGEAGVSSRVTAREDRGREMSQHGRRNAAPSRTEDAVTADATLLASAVHSSSDMAERADAAFAPRVAAESHSERLHRRLDAPAAAWDAPSAAPHAARLSRRVLDADVATLAVSAAPAADEDQSVDAAPVARRTRTRPSATRRSTAARRGTGRASRSASKPMWVKAPGGYRSAAPSAGAAVHAASRGIHAGRRVLRAAPSAQPLASGTAPSTQRRLTAAPTGYASSAPDLSWLAGLASTLGTEQSDATVAEPRRRATARVGATARTAAATRRTGAAAARESVATRGPVAQRSSTSVRAFERSEQPSLVSRASRRSLSMGVEPVFAALAAQEEADVSAEPQGVARRASGRTRAATVNRRLNTKERRASYRSTEQVQAARARGEERMVQLALSAGADEVQTSQGPTRRAGALERAENRGVHGASSAASPVVRTLRRAVAEQATLAMPSAERSVSATAERRSSRTDAGERYFSRTARSQTNKATAASGTLGRASVYGMGAQSLPMALGALGQQADAEAQAENVAARPLGRTLGFLGEQQTGRSASRRGAARRSRTRRGAAAQRTMRASTADTGVVARRADQRQDGSRAMGQDTAPLQETFIDGTSVPGVAPSSGAVPSWAERAAFGTSVLPQTERSDRQAPSSSLRLGGGLLGALARAGRPEDVVRVILERSEGLRSLGSELPSPVATLVERIVRIEDGAAAQERRGEAAIDTEGVLSPRRSHGSVRASRLSSRSPSYRTLSRGSAGAGSNAGVGASQTMKLANKLMKLIHLAERDRKDAQSQVRMAEDSAEARAEGRGGKPTGGRPSEPVSIQALQRDVLEAVLRELELTMVRNQGDPDGWW